MKKIYSKITKERKVQFQIETDIYEEENGHKMVEKKPLTAEAIEHLMKMYENYQYYRKQGIQVLLPCEQKESSLLFPYVEGKSLYNDFLDAAEKKDKNAILQVFQLYESIIGQMYLNQHEFIISESFKEIFGEISLSTSMIAAKKVDIDLTFDNIVFTEDGIKVIDYEWIFDFDVPVKFPVYRAIFALFAKHADILSGVVTDDELYRMASITKEECSCFDKMNNQFMEYVEGKQDSYANILPAYLKPEDGINVSDHAYVYWANSGHYSNERMVHHPVPLQDNIKLVISVEGFSDTDMIRIDPTEGASMIQVLRFEAESDTEVYNIMDSEYESNHFDRYEDYIIFTCGDPQIILPIQKTHKWKNIIFEYKIVYNNLDNMELFFYVMRSVCKREIKKWQDKTREKQELLEEKEQLLTECAHRISDYEEIIQLQKDKLAYIENTKAYQALLKNKVDNIRLWDRLKA